MLKLKKLSSVLLLALLTLGCLDPYQPPTSSENTDLLVINGHVNSTDNVATVRITPTLPLTSTAAYPPETNAHITIEDEEGNSLILLERAKGTYSVSQIFNPDVRYRLKIVTKGNSLEVGCVK